MKCKKCGSQFNKSKIIDGKRRVFNKRKFCLSCSPFGGRNTVDISINGYVRHGQMVVCRLCGRKYFYEKAKGHTRTVCNSCMANRWRERRKAMAISYKGGKCIGCGYSKFSGALVFHHRSPIEKEFSISGGHSMSWEKTKGELDKCDLLCANCHAEIHNRLTDVRLVQPG